MKKRTLISLLLILFILLFLMTVPTMEVEDDVTIWETDGKVVLHYSQKINKTIYLEEGQNLSFLMRGDPMEDTVTVAIYDSANQEITSFAQVGSYRVVNWTVPDDGKYRFVFHNPVRWHKKVHISIVETNKKVNISVFEAIFQNR
ncbi:hypothetical protein C9439_02785 [archaeon SCG-AAA382B04]|nr:hypothetical protein C9439_02785 [archaeon SCG-AAA382B04]